MGVSNYTLEALIGSDGVQQVNRDFGDVLGETDIGSLTMTDIKKNYGAAKKELINFYKGGDNKKSQGYVKNFLEMILRLAKSEYEENREDIDIRDYQLKFILDCLKFLQNDTENAGYIHSATSTGKTIVFGEIARHITEIYSSGKILIVTSGNESRDRAKEEFKTLGIPVGIYKGGKKVSNERVTIISRQSLIRSGIERLNPDDYSLMICDEIHDGFLGPKSKSALSKFSCKKIGFTATPELRDKHVEEIFGKKIGEYLIDEAQRDGHLPDINDEHSIEIPDRYFDVLEKQGDDYTEESLGKFDIDHVFPQVLEFFKKGPGKGKQFAIFMPSVASSERLARYLQVVGLKVQHVDGDTKDMKDIKQDFENGTIQLITNCEKMTQSWDSDAIDGVMNLRPTLSPSKYFQILGRALHGKKDIDGVTYPKDEVMMVDLVNSKDSFQNRSISISGVKKVLQSTTQGYSGKKEKIDRISPQVIRELQMYYNFDIDIEPTSILKTLEKFRKNIGAKKQDFYQNLDKDITHYDTLTEETIDVTLISNSALGKSYSGRKRDISISLGVFLRLIEEQQIGILKQRSKLPKALQLEEYIQKFQEDDGTGDVAIFKYVFQNTGLQGHVFHLFELLGKEQQEEVGEIQNIGKIPEQQSLRIAYQFYIQYIGRAIHELKAIERLQKKEELNNAKHFEGHGLYIENGKVTIQAHMLQKIKKQGIKFHFFGKGEPARAISWSTVKTITSIHCGEIDHEILHKRVTSDDEIYAILESFFITLGYEVELQGTPDMMQYDQNFYKEHWIFEKVGGTTIRPLNDIVENFSIKDHLQHVYDTILSLASKREVGIESKGKISKHSGNRIVTQLRKQILETYTWAEKNRSMIQQHGFDGEKCGIQYNGKQVSFKSADFKKVRTQGISSFYGSGYYSFSLIVANLPREYCPNVDFGKKRLSEDDTYEIIVGFHKYLGFEIEKDNNSQQVSHLYLDYFIDNLTIEGLKQDFISQLGLIPFLGRDGELCFDLSQMVQKNTIKTEMGLGRNVSYDTEALADRLLYLMEQSSFKRDIIRSILRKHTHALTDGFESYGSIKKDTKIPEETPKIAYAFEKFFTKVGITTITRENAEEIKSVTKSLITHGDLDGAFEELIQLRYDSNVNSYVYDSQVLQNSPIHALPSFFTFIHRDINFYNHIPYWLKRPFEKIPEYLEKKDIGALIKLLEEVFIFLELPLRDIHNYPLTLTGIQEKITSGAWNTRLRSLGIIFHAGVLDFSHFNKNEDNNGEYRWLQELIGYIEQGISEGELELLQQNGFNISKGRFNYDDVLTVFCKDIGMKYKNKTQLETEQRLLKKPETLFTPEGITSLQGLGVRFPQEKTIDLTDIRGVQRFTLGDITGRSFFNACYGLLTEREKNIVMGQAHRKKFTKISSKHEVTYYLRYIFEKAGWNVIPESFSGVQENEKRVLQTIQKWSGFGGKEKDYLLSLFQDNADDPLITKGEMYGFTTTYQDVTQSMVFYRKNNSGFAGAILEGTDIFFSEIGNYELDPDGYILMIDWDNKKFIYGKVIKQLKEGEDISQYDLEYMSQESGEKNMIIENCYDKKGHDRVIIEVWDTNI